MSAPRFSYVWRDVAPAAAEACGAHFIAEGATGVELRDGTTMQRGPGDGRVRVVGWFAQRAEAERVAASLTGAHVDEIVGDGWRDAYKAYFKPFALTSELWVCPPWERLDGALVLDPGRAFGTGLHATTALVATALDAHRETFRDGVVLDVGTGSGILALAALRFGARRAVAIDCDPDVVDVVADNAARNGLAARIEVDTRDVSEVDATFPFVVANIRAPVLLGMVDALVARTTDTLVLSGVLASEAASVRAPFVSAGLASVATLRRDEVGQDDAWTALVLRRS
ncbi:MAG: 50S ribosomal protein L11 methyltransferase [Myxococcota bacterium]